MGPCCVEGCKSIKEGISYFEFPTSRSLRSKWLQMVQIPSKVPLGTVVCSQHFNEDDYEVLRGKVRLKRKVVPTLRLNTTKMSEPSECILPESTEELPNPDLPQDPIRNGDKRRRSKSSRGDKKSSKASKRKKRYRSSSIEDSAEEYGDIKRSKYTKEGDKERSRSSSTEDSAAEHRDKRKRSSKGHKKRFSSSRREKRSRSSSTEDSAEENGDKNKSKSTKRGDKKRSKSTREGDRKRTRCSSTDSAKENGEKRKRSTSLTRGEKRCSSPARGVVKKRSTSHRESGNKTEDESEVLAKLICTEERSSMDSFDRPPDPEPDPKQPPDFEDMITNYHIKNKPNALLPGIEIEVPPVSAMDDTIVINDKDAAPVFIEINVDKDKATSADCLMVLESVQVEVDPSTLMLERDSDEDQLCEPVVSLVDEPTRADHSSRSKDPISLVTSSDDDDVIIEEPHIDTVEVSDETDEDDMPLVKFVPKKPTKTPKKPTKKKKITKLTKRKASGVNLKNLVWNGAYDNYCVRCNLTFLNPAEFQSHKSMHATILQVCSICNYTSASKPQFARHLRKHKDERRYKCHLCDYRARHNMSLKYHLQSHETEAPLSSRCIKCGLLKHAKSCKESKVFACDRCDYMTKRRNDLKRHWLKRHIDTVNINSDTEASKSGRDE